MATPQPTDRDLDAARAGPAAPAHTREEIAAAALAIADAEGIDAVTMRRVARDVGRRHDDALPLRRTKDDLLALMSDAAVGELIVPDERAGRRLARGAGAIGRRTNATLERHPWLLNAEAMRGMRIGPNGMRHFEQSLAAVAALALDDVDKLEVIAMVDDYVFGYALRRWRTSSTSRGPARVGRLS